MSLHDIVIAHRGGAGIASENTREAFALSHALGVRLLETDIRVTRDGVAVCFHDATLERTTGLPGRIADHTWHDLQHARCADQPLLRLDDALAAFPDAAFLVDVKQRTSIEPTVRVLRSLRAGDRVCVADGRDVWLRDIAERTGCARALGWASLARLMLAAKSGFSTRGTGMAASGAFAAHAPTRLGGVRWMTEPRVAARLATMTRDAGLRLVTWTVDDGPTMARLLDAGVDAVITDRPDVAREVLIARGAWRAQSPKLTAAARLITTPTVSPTVSGTPSRSAVG